MTNGVVLDTVNKYGPTLLKPVCPDVEIIEKQAGRRQLAPLFSGQRSDKYVGW